MRHDDPTVIVGTRDYCDWVMSAMRREMTDRMAALIHERSHVPTKGRPTHYVETVDGWIGMGNSFAEAFTDLVRERT